MLPALPVLMLQQMVPFGGFLLFLVLYLAVVRNQKVPYYLRFHVLQAILIDIVLVVVSLAPPEPAPGQPPSAAPPGQSQRAYRGDSQNENRK